MNAQHRQKEHTEFGKSHALTIGGLAFTAIGFATPANYTSVHNPNNTSQYNTTYKALPFFQQGPRSICIITGCTVTITGLISMLANK